MHRLYLILFTLLLTACNRDQDIINNNPFIIGENDAPMVIAHGGAKALFPENTMVAFDGAVKIGIDVLEMDVSLTKDSILVCHHDETIDRMSNGEGKVIDYTFTDLKAFNFGFSFEDINGNKPYENEKVEITALEDVMLKYNQYPMVIEIKNSGDAGKKAADILMNLIITHLTKSSVIIASFSDEIIDYINDKEQGFLVSTAESEARKMVITTKSGMGIFYKPKAMALQLPIESAGLDLTKKRVIKNAHKRNMAIHYWTINDKENMKLLIENGADGLITDRPDLMNQVLLEMGY
ncbi:MAG: glycerophosphodiester phosphodiesterase [Bacteroidia bacterium]